MAEDKVYKPETIDEVPFPAQVIEGDFNSSTPTTAGQSQTQKTTAQRFPEKRVAVELISAALNTKSKKVLQTFQLAQSGGFQIGDYTEGVSGQLDITPNGISARDIAGVLTFVLDALTGDATFKGTVQAGSVVSGQVIVGNNTWIIDGDPDAPRILLYNNGIPEIVIGEV